MEPNGILRSSAFHAYPNAIPVNSSQSANYFNPVFQQQPQIIYHPSCQQVLYPIHQNPSSGQVKLVKVQYQSNNDSANSGPQTSSLSGYSAVHNQQHMVPVILMPAPTQVKSAPQYRPRFVAMNNRGVYSQAIPVPVSVRKQTINRSDRDGHIRVDPAEAQDSQEPGLQSDSDLKESDGNASPKDSENSNELNKGKHVDQTKGCHGNEIDKEIYKQTSKDNQILSSETTKDECDDKTLALGVVSPSEKKGESSFGTKGNGMKKRNAANHCSINKSKRRLVSSDIDGTAKTSLGWSTFKGVTFHRHTKKWEAHIWATKHLYLGSFDTEVKAAKAWDRACISTKKIASESDSNASELNFSLSSYAQEINILIDFNQRELVSYIRRHSCCFTRGSSQYRGVTKNRTNGRWEARLGQYAKRKYKYLGIFNTVRSL